MLLDSKKYKRQPISISDVQDKALHILREVAGFHVDEAIIDDDWHRCKLESRLHLPDKDGAYAIHYNNGEFPLMAWHDWTIHSKPQIEKLFDKSRLQTAVDKGDFKKSVEEFKKKLEEKQNEIYEANAKKAQEFVAKLQSIVTSDNVYLANKHVTAVEGLLGDKDNLYYPIQDINGKVWSFQQIYYNRHGNKISYLMKGGKKKGNFFQIKGDDDCIFFAEGIATAISIYLATGATVVCCIDAGNIEPVISAFRKKYPSGKFVIVADNDFTGKDNKRKPYNKGVDKANKAARKYNCKVITPMQGEVYEDKKPLTDANDYHNKYGLQALTEFISNALIPKESEQKPEENSEGTASIAQQETVWRPASGIKKLPTSTGEDVEADKDWIEETRPVVQYDPDMVVQCRNDLAKYLYPHVYIFGNNLVRVIRLKEKKVLRKDRQGNETALIPQGTTSIEILDAKSVCIEAAKILRWEKWDERSKDNKSCTPPTDVCDSLYHDRHLMNFRILNRISNCPVIFPDGTILFREGYYEEYGLLLDFCGVTHYEYTDTVFSKEIAAKYINYIREALSEFPFKSNEDESVAVAMVLTAVARASIKKAPMFAFNANASGVGKSTICDFGGIVATGRCPSCVTWKDDRVEMNKEIFATVLEGAQVVVIDNANDVKVNDPTLAQAVERESIKGRILGMSKNGEAPCNALWMINGKRITIVEDMRRRTLLCTLDTNEEHPERHQYKNKNFYDLMLENRKEIVNAAIIVLRAYIDAGKPGIENLSPYPDYQEWSDFVRAPIIWLGLEDPLKAQESMAKIDPVRMEFGSILKAWHDKYKDKPITVKDIFSNKPPESAVLDLNTNVLSEIFNEMFGDKISNGKVGKYLARHNGMIIDGLRFIQLEEKTRDNRTQFCVMKIQ